MIKKHYFKITGYILDQYQNGLDAVILAKKKTGFVYFRRTYFFQKEKDSLELVMVKERKGILVDFLLNY